MIRAAKVLKGSKGEAKQELELQTNEKAEMKAKFLTES
jgi:hypothetical protein